MGFGITVVPTLGYLSSYQALKLANMYLDHACNECDPAVALVLCHEVEVSLVQAKKAARQDSHVSKGEIGTAFISLSQLLEDMNHHSEAEDIRKKGEKYG
jgi:hypothetical protein